MNVNKAMFVRGISKYRLNTRISLLIQSNWYHVRILASILLKARIQCKHVVYMYARYIMRAMQIRAMMGLVVYVHVRGDKSCDIFS